MKTLKEHLMELLHIHMDSHNGKTDEKFLTKINEIEQSCQVSGYVPFQKCPVCDGEGKVKPLENKFATMPMYIACDVCKGAKIIQMSRCGMNINF